MAFNLERVPAMLVNERDCTGIEIDGRQVDDKGQDSSAAATRFYHVLETDALNGLIHIPHEPVLPTLRRDWPLVTRRQASTLQSNSYIE
jgi:hypothetical protein